MEMKLVWVNTQMDQDTKNKLEALAEADGRTRSSMVRWLIASEWDRRTEVEALQSEHTPSL